MKRTRSKSTITIAVVGSVIFILVLTVGTILTGLLAKQDTEKAVESVSLLYLDELAAGVDSFIAKPLFAANVLEEFKSASLKKKAAFEDEVHVDLKGLRVLVAEDVEVNAEILQMILESREIESDIAENGKVAVELFESHPEGFYAAVLMDVRMPEMDGLEATRRIRDMERSDSKKIPIIALTVNAFDEDVQSSLQAGLNAHLTKPIQPEVLFETLESLIKNGETTGEGAK